MSKDGTWKREISKKDQIIALSTKVAELQAKLENQDKRGIALAAQAKKEPPSVPTTEDDVGGTRHSKREPYTVAAWRLTKKEDKVCMHGKDYFWCTGDHWSGSTKHNGMYADHKICNHQIWWILATFCLLLSLPIQMTLLLPTILYSTFNTFIKIMDIAACTAKYIEQELPGKLISWLSYLFFPAIIAVLSSFHIVVSSFRAIPIYFRTLVWHPDG
jgi:hypothetical protein